MCMARSVVSGCRERVRKNCRRVARVGNTRVSASAVHQQGTDWDSLLGISLWCCSGMQLDALLLESLALFTS